MKQKLFSMLALLLTAATGAWAQSAFTAKAITSASQLTSTDDEAYVARCMPSDFLAVGEDVAKAWTGAPTGSAILIYAIEGDKIKMATFFNGDNKATTGATWSIATFKDQLTNGKFFYTAATYSVTVAEGTEDFDKWTISPTEATAGSPVTATYKGEKKVKSVKAVKKAPAMTDLATITATYEAKDGETLTGTLASNVKISIAAGATVTLKDVNITNLGNGCDWAGISCPGDATLVLEGTNTVCAGRGSDGYNNYPGIYIAPDKTLTIQGDGTLTAYSNDSQPWGAGIGSGYQIACGNIVINSGTITATGGQNAAGIGGGRNASCGNITINGGTIEATGGQNAAGIGGGYGNGTCGTITISGGTVEATGGSNAAGIGGGNSNGACGTITITKGVTSVKATKGEGAESIGAGKGGQNITVNIEAGTNVIMGPAEGHALSASVVGEIVGTDGKAYAAADKDILPTGVTAVAMVAYKSATTGKSLAIALADEGSMNWETAKTTCAGKAAIGGKSWKLPSMDEWKQMFSANGGNEGSYTGLNTAITSAGGTALQGENSYWSSSATDDPDLAQRVYLRNGSGDADWSPGFVGTGYRVRACFAF